MPALGLTLWSERYDDYTLRQIGQSLTNEVKKIPDVADVRLIGGRSWKYRLNWINPGWPRTMLIFKYQSATTGKQMNSPAQVLLRADTAFTIETGKFSELAEEVGKLVVVNHQQPVFLAQVARIVDGPVTPNQYASFGYGQPTQQEITGFSEYPAVTLSVAKRKSVDAGCVCQKRSSPA